MKLGVGWGICSVVVVVVCCSKSGVAGPVRPDAVRVDRPAPTAGALTHREQMEDPYLPGPGPMPVPRGPVKMRWSRGPYTSVQVNVDAYGGNIPGDAANEPSLAIDPTHPSRIVIGWRQFNTVASNFRQAGWAYSHDGGHTWTFPGVLEPGVFRSDPVLAADADGNFYYYSLVGDVFTCWLFKSTDGGVSWGDGVYAYGGDKSWIAIDRTNGIGRGHMYAAWSWGAACCGYNTFNRSINGGQSFSYPMFIPPTPPVFGTLVVGPDGELYVAGVDAPSFSNDAFLVAKSTNAQNPAVTPVFAFSTPVNLGGELLGAGGPNPIGLLGQVWIACDHSNGPTRGNVYLLCSVDPPGPDPLDVMFARSTDGGSTWSAPRRVNDDPTNNGAWQWFGTMSVAPNGRIDAIWNDTRNDPSVTWSELYYAYSLDGGLTFFPSVPVSPAFNHFLGYPNNQKLGDYYHMISDDLGASVAYAATFNGEQDVYFLRIGTFDCNGNGIDDEADLTGGTSVDCNSNAVPDDCEPDRDCNHNGIQDICDVAAGTSLDCTQNGTPDECEPDCNANGTADSCDVAGTTSADCNQDGVPDECQLTWNDCNENHTPDECDVAALDCNHDEVPDDCEAMVHDCNHNGVPDDCDIADATSADCTMDGIPDECDPDCDSNGWADSCDIETGRALDCNGNGMPDVCDIASGFSADADADTIPDECDLQLCTNVWDGFQPNPPFSFQRPLGEIDYDGDGIFWDVPKANAVVFAPGCESGSPFDNTIRVSVDTSDPNHPENGYVASEYFHTLNGELDCGAALYSLSFSVKISSTLASKYDWDFLVYDVLRGRTVVQLAFTSTASLKVPAGQRGKILVEDPAPGPGFISTGISLALNTCYIIEVVLDNRPTVPAGERVKVYVNGGAPKVTTARLDPLALRMDKFTLQPVRNDATTPGSPLFWLDAFHYCVTGPALMTWSDCNHNCVDDAWDLAGGLWRDCNHNAVPDTCEPPTDCNYNGLQDFCDVVAETSGDCDSNGVPDECDIALHDCNHNAVPDACDTAGGTSVDCTGNGTPDECEPDCNLSGWADSCDIAAGTSADCNANGIPDECDAATRDCNTNALPDDCDIVAGTSRDCNLNGIPDECDVVARDCNDNGYPDDCDVTAGTSRDCDHNRTPDECDIAALDCNGTGFPDACDITAGTSPDCTHNGIPDECEPDCNSNGVPDSCDIAVGTAEDCNHNGTPDPCDLASGAISDCNSDHVPDDCQLAPPHDCCEPHFGAGCSDLLIAACVCDYYPYCCQFQWDGVCVFLVEYFGCGVCFDNDCNVNGTPDECDVAQGTSADCNGNLTPDECEVDCNGNDTPDECDLAAGTSPDCNVNDVPDECDIGVGTSFDCNTTGTPDECETDCNLNALADECDIAAGTSVDCNTDGVPDDCQRDCDGNGTTDDCELASGAAVDCNSNGVPDGCDVRPSTTYLIKVAGLVNVPDECCGCGSYYNACALEPGFRWFDAESRKVEDVRIEFNIGIECHDPGTLHTTSLNGYPAPSYFSTEWLCDCVFTEGVPVEVTERPHLYQLGGWNTFLITNPITCLGFIPNAAWGDGVYGRVTVAYDTSADCNHDLVPDECELAGGDCNTNAIPDDCDIAGGTSSDADGNGVPDECEAAQVIGAVPAPERSLWRSARNTLRLTFDRDLTLPGPGEVWIQQLLESGGFGPDFSAAFTFTVETDGLGRPRILKIRETGTTTVLSHGTWVAVRNVGGRGAWAGVEDFEVQYVVQIGDVNNDGKVLATDLSAIFPKIPTDGAADQERADVNGDGRVLTTDLSAVFPRIPSAPVPKPSGH